MPTNTDHTPLAAKLELALVTYLGTVLDDMGLTGLQVLSSFSDTEALASPRLVITCDAMTAVSMDLPGIMDCTVQLDYLTQSPATIAQHRSAAGTIEGWMQDITTVQAALNATDAIHCYFYQWAGNNFTKDADDGAFTTRITLMIRAQGRQI